MIKYLRISKILLRKFSTKTPKFHFSSLKETKLGLQTILQEEIRAEEEADVEINEDN